MAPPRILAGSKCAIGCGRTLATGAQSNFCPTCRQWFYSKKKKTRGQLYLYKCRVNLARARLEFVDEENPKMTVTNGYHEVPKTLKVNPLLKDRMTHGNATAH